MTSLKKGHFTRDWKKFMLALITCGSSNVKEGGNVPCRRNGTEGKKMHFVRETEVQYDCDRKSEERGMKLEASRNRNYPKKYAGVLKCP